MKPAREATNDANRNQQSKASLGDCLLAEFLGQLADLGFGVGAVAAQGLQEGSLHSLAQRDTVWGETCREVGHLGGPEMAGGGGCGLAAGLTSSRSPPMCRWIGAAGGVIGDAEFLE